MNVVKVADHDVFEKVDTQYVEDLLANLEHIGIVFICTSEGGEEDEWTDEDGLRHIIIDLPYEEVRRMPDVRPLMLAKARERLGLVA